MAGGTAVNAGWDCDPADLDGIYVAVKSSKTKRISRKKKKEGKEVRRETVGANLMPTRHIRSPSIFKNKKAYGKGQPRIARGHPASRKPKNIDILKGGLR